MLSSVMPMSEASFSALSPPPPPPPESPPPQAARVVATVAAATKLTRRREDLVNGSPLERTRAPVPGGSGWGGGAEPARWWAGSGDSRRGPGPSPPGARAGPAGALLHPGQPDRPDQTGRGEEHDQHEDHAVDDVGDLGGLGGVHVQ